MRSGAKLRNDQKLFKMAAKIQDGRQFDFNINSDVR